MICPQCNVEYRPGFTRCSDCDVDLVEEPPHYALAGKRAAEPGDPNEDPFCSFWKGEDPRVHAELCEVLDEAGIPHKSVFRRDHLFNFSNFPRFEIGVPFSLFEKAENAVHEAFGTEDEEDRETLNRPRLLPRPEEGEAEKEQSGENSLEIPSVEEEDLPGPPTAGQGEDWYPEDATQNVWSGEAAEISDFLVAALHENGIHCRLDLDQQGTHARLYVQPHDVSRAQEIVREVIEATPPE